MIKKLPLILLGNVLTALSVAYFMQPAGLLVGGSTGIGMVLSYMTSLPVSVGIWGASLGFLVLGYIALGKAFALNTLISSIAYPLSFSLASWLFTVTGPITDDIFLCMAFAGIVNGIGVGILLRVGASSGGTDVAAAVVNSKLNIPVSVTLNVIDCVLLCLQMPFSSIERILYSILFVAVYSIFTGKMAILGEGKIEVQICSERYDEINAVILSRLDHGSTLVHIKGGYTGEETYAVQTVVTKRDLFRVRDAVLEIDPQAFIVINSVSDVNGCGFTLDKNKLKAS